MTFVFEENATLASKVQGMYVMMEGLGIEGLDLFQSLTQLQIISPLGVFCLKEDCPFV